ncbi:MAG: HIT family protein [Candidatus Liptonbacteria bacterium]|nr:HIT family protein [Candidatus Liptonbacteria bacterium]
MTDCLFCKIARKEISSQDVYEDADTFAFLDIHPRAPGHVMVIPKRHADTILALDESAVGPLFAAVKKVTAAIKRAFNPDGFTIGINHGAASGQAVDHVHVHVIPRWRDDGGGSLHSVVQNPPEESPDEIRDRIRAGI